MTLMIIGVLIGAAIGWIVASAWRSTPTSQARPLVFLTRKANGETYRLDQSVLNVDGLGSRTVILYRVSDYSLEAWPGDRVDAEFDNPPTPPSPEVQQILDVARKKALARS